MNVNEKSTLFSAVIMILFLSIFYLSPTIAQNSTSITESHLVGSCQAFTKLQNEKIKGTLNIYTLTNGNRSKTNFNYLSNKIF